MEEAASSTPSPDDGSHLDAIQMPDLDADFVDPDAPINLDDLDDPRLAPEPEKISRDAFFVVFETAFSVPAMMSPEFAPIAIHPEEKPSARAASDATYSLLEIYYPAALMPQSETLAHLMVAGPFFVGKAMIVREILRARQMRPAAPPKEARNVDPAPPEPEVQESGTAISDPLAFLDAERAAA